MSNVSVSIIVPIYNVEKYLSECLDSLERQSFKNYEVIMVNDGTTDKSRDIALRYSERDKRFILIDRPNGGLSAARNTGIDAARGEYLVFLDSDDYLVDDAIEKLYAKAKEDDLDELRFAAATFEDGTKTLNWKRSNNESGYKYLGKYPDIYKGYEFYRKTIDEGDYFPSCCLMLVRKNVIAENSLRFKEEIIHEDNLFHFQLTHLCKKVAVLNEPLYCRRYRTGSITTSSNTIKRIRSMCVSAEETDAFIMEHPTIPHKNVAWQISFFSTQMLLLRDMLTKEEQKSRDVLEYFYRIRPIVRRHCGKYGTAYLLLKRSPHFFSIYNFLNNSMHRCYREITLKRNKDK